MSGSHTKGPWAVTSKFEVGPVSDNDDQSNGMVTPIADVFGGNREANTRLIAAAPALLDALKALRLQALHSSVNDRANEWGMAALALANAAISKAEGTTP